MNDSTTSAADATVDVTEDNFNEIIDGNDIVILDFWAEWCGPCKGFAPVFEAAAAKNPDIVFAKIDTEKAQGLAGHFQIRSIPTLMIFKEQIGVFSQAGAMPEGEFGKLIDKTRDLDMEQVRIEIANQQEENPEEKPA